MTDSPRRLVAALRAARREDLLLVIGYPALMWLLATLDQGGARPAFWPEAGSAWWPAVGIAGSLTLVFRRSAPVFTAVAAGTAGTVLLLMGQTSGLLLFWETVFVLVLFAGDRLSRAAEVGALALTAALTLVAFAVSGELRQGVLVALLVGITLLLPAEWASNLRKERRLAAAEATRASAVEESARQRATIEAGRHELAIAAERQRMARELHDVLSARMSAIALQAGAALRAGTAELASEVLAHVRQESMAGLRELNSMIRLLNAGEAQDAVGTLGDLEPLVAAHAAAGVPVTSTLDVQDPGSIPLPVQTAAYRIVAESLVNALRHAPGAPIALSVHGGAGHGGAGPGSVEVSVANGPPRSAPGEATGTGTGLASLRLRVDQLGGTLTASGHDGGWEVAAWLPVAIEHDPGDAGPGANAVPAGSVRTPDGGRS